MCNYFCIYLMLFSTNKRKNGTFSAPSLGVGLSALAVLNYSLKLIKLKQVVELTLNKTKTIKTP